MSRWFRLYDDLVDDPKIQRLPGETVKALLNLWCLASQNDGLLPATDDIAFKLRMKPSKVEHLLSVLGECGLIDSDETGLRPHNWNERQYKSDVKDPTAPSRQKAYRERLKNRNATVTNTDTRTETEQIQKTEQKDDRPAGLPTYAFEDGIIRLNQRDFDNWRKAFSYLDLAAELLSLSKWAESEGKNWFYAVKGALAKRNREVKSAKEKQQQEPFKWNGIEGVL
jgi:DNA-binding transcriptional ArsR family regulator